ncbi:unnamed protein product, partial [Iphiclides podalirius]
MSNLSGYDGDAVGFDSVPPESKPSAASSTQTSEFGERGAASQTAAAKDVGCTASAEDFQDIAPEPGYPQGLNEFLRRVVPGVLEQLAHHDQGAFSSDSEEEVSRAVLLHELGVGRDSGCGDHHAAALGVSWSCAGGLAVAVGAGQHESWCERPGLVRLYSLRRRGGPQATDVEERECVTAIRYHPTVATLLAYGTASGELVARQGSGEALTAPAGGSARVSALRWADAHLANVYLTMLVRARGVRRCASDQVLFSASSDGALTVWRVNIDLRTFEKLVRYELDASLKARPDITCFDIPRSHPLRSVGDRAPDVFVVGAKCGGLLLCGVGDQLEDVDPLVERLEGHSTCVLDVAFGPRPGLFVSLSIDSELRVHRAGRPGALRIFCLDAEVSCMSWLGNGPCVVIGLTGSEKETLRVYNVSTGKRVPVEGMSGDTSVTCVDVCQSGAIKIAAGYAGNTVRVWELPALQDKFVWYSFDE